MRKPSNPDYVYIKLCPPGTQFYFVDEPDELCEVVEIGEFFTEYRPLSMRQLHSICKASNYSFVIVKKST